MRVPNYLFVILGLATVTLLAEEKKQSATKGGAFDDTGTVAIKEMDSCMIGLKFWLHPKSQGALRLKPTSGHDPLVLEQAAKNMSRVRVQGKWRQAAECRYVKISKVEAIEN